MKPSSKILLWLALILVFVVAALIFLRQPAVSDQAQIARQLEVARAAGEKHNVSGVMSIVSTDYHDANVPSPVQLRFLLSKVQGSQSVRVIQSLPAISVSGDTATSVSHLEVDSQADGHVLYSHDVTAQWKREDASRFLIIPTKVWRITSADYGSFGFD